MTGVLAEGLPSSLLLPKPSQNAFRRSDRFPISAAFHDVTEFLLRGEARKSGLSFAVSRWRTPTGRGAGGWPSTPPSNASAPTNTIGTTSSEPARSPSLPLSPEFDPNTHPTTPHHKRRTTWKEKTPPPGVDGWISLAAQDWVNLSERHRKPLSVLKPSQSLQAPRPTPPFVLALRSPPSLPRCSPPISKGTVLYCTMVAKSSRSFAFSSSLISSRHTNCPGASNASFTSDP